MEQLSDFVLLQTEGDWQHYKNEIVRKVVGDLDQNNLFNTPSNFQFPPLPESFPCLSASLVVSAPVELEDTVTYKVNCCYVYPQDAKNLLKFVKPVKALDVAPLPTDNAISIPVATRQNIQMNQIFAILVGMASELAAIGAVKPRELIEVIKKAHKEIPNDSSDFLKLFNSTLND